MEPNNGLSGAKIALLVDFDNVVLGLEDPGFDIELVVNALRERGTIVLGRVYGDWYRHNRHRRRLMEQGLELVETPAFGPVIKNSADIRIALDGYEIGLTQSHIDTFAIVSGDSDFLPLIKKLQSLGRRVLVICGNRFTSDMLRRNCNEFISYENLLAQSVGATEDATTLEGAFSLLHRAMAALRERGTEIRGSGVKQMMIQLNPVFSERTFGCTQFRQFLQKAVFNGVVKLGPRDKVSGEFHVLLPDEDEAPIQQKIERRAENRARRDDKISQIAARIDSIPVEEVTLQEEESISVEVELDVTADALESSSDHEVYTNGYSDSDGGAVFADDAFGYDPELMSQALTESAQEIAQNTIARGELLSRGLRPSNRRFSGKAGRPALHIEDLELSADDLDEQVSSTETEETPVEATEAAPEASVEAEAPTDAATDNRRVRTRRRRRNAAGQITVVSDEPVAAEADGDPASSTEPEAESLTPIANTGDDQSTIEHVETGMTPTALEPDDETPVGGVLPVEADSEAISEVQTALAELEQFASSSSPSGAGTYEITVSSEAPIVPEAPGGPKENTLEVVPDASLEASQGVTVEADAPALPEGADELQTADPMGVPAIQANAREQEDAQAEVTPEPTKPKRRRPSRAKVKKEAAPAESVSDQSEPVQPEPPSIGAEALTPESLDQPEPTSLVDAASIQIEALPPLTSEGTGEADAALATESTESVDTIGSDAPAEAAPAKPKRRRPSRAKKTPAAESSE